jgi:hypothetical protein
MILELKAPLKLINLAHNLGLKSEDLDELVHDIANAHASVINNRGLEEQLEFLIKELGYESTRDELEKLAKESQ